MSKVFPPCSDWSRKWPDLYSRYMLLLTSLPFIYAVRDIGVRPLVRSMRSKANWTLEEKTFSHVNTSLPTFSPNRFPSVDSDTVHTCAGKGHTRNPELVPVSGCGLVQSSLPKHKRSTSVIFHVKDQPNEIFDSIVHHFSNWETDLVTW